MSAINLTRRDFVKAGTAAATAAIVPAIRTVYAHNPTNEKTSDIVNYNEQMEYRRAGRTGLMISAVCLGGHWKRMTTMVPGLYKKGWLSADLQNSEFEKNRYDVVSRCIDRGINYIDACTKQEVIMYAKALKGRRDKMHLGFSWYQEEMRSLCKQMNNAEKAGDPKPPGWITQMLKQALDNGFKETGLDYVDVWRITCFERSGQHTDNQMEECLEALAWAKKTGRARFTGISSHDRPHIKRWIQQAPEQLEVICTPYTAKTKLAGAKIEVAEESNASRIVAIEGSAWKDSLWATMQERDIAWFGIKPFASNSIFKGDSSLGNEYEEQDNKLARLTIRAILTNPVITAPIPGMINETQVDNVAIAVLQRRKLDVEEQSLLDRATEEGFANLPHHYKWLNEWNYV
jgi:aryl-alcohol dehydrogenase-like predicted oxidoreductase